MRKTLAIATVSLLSGCATSTLSQDDANKMADLNLEGFLATRFSDMQSSRYGNVYLYNAKFTGSNNVQLFRPTNEIVRFCLAQHGTPTRVVQFTGNPLNKIFDDKAYERAMNLAIETRTYARAIGVSADVENNAAAIAFENEVQRSQGNDAMFDRDGAEKAVAETKRTYGTFECRDSANTSSYKWKVSIVPVGYKPKNPTNVLEPHEMSIQIRPIY
jgi:hypothetical protein